ncbi:P-loop containing nucleoside triphosphate hydrolase protein [Atractiella rhizophila]|nr:P-loop containing nucleoside triphosphate hydrolase protein [Atractiella rhizophila]
MDVWTEEDLKILIHRAASERRTRSTVKNDTSSRSHAVIHLTVLHPVPGQESVASRFTMIDLAGFERSEYLTKNRSQERVKESIETNKSLAALKDCIRSRLLAEEDKRVHVPWRNSKLTMVLRSVFERGVNRQSRLLILGCLSPCGIDLEDSLNTLKYVTPFRLSAEDSVDEGMESSVMAGQSMESENPNLWSRARCLQYLQAQTPRLAPFGERLFPAQTSNMKGLWALSEAQIFKICSTEPKRDTMSAEALENDKKATDEALRRLKYQLHDYHMKLKRLRQKWNPPSGMSNKAIVEELGGKGGKAREVGEVVRTNLSGKVDHLYDQLD